MEGQEKSRRDSEREEEEAREGEGGKELQQAKERLRQEEEGHIGKEEQKERVRTQAGEKERLREEEEDRAKEAKWIRKTEQEVQKALEEVKQLNPLFNFCNRDSRLYR